MPPTKVRLENVRHWDDVLDGNNNKERVLRALMFAWNTTEGGWTTGVLLCQPSIGGSEGLRRLRGLRQEGWSIGMKRVPDRATRLYRLVAINCRHCNTGYVFNHNHKCDICNV